MRDASPRPASGILLKEPATQRVIAGFYRVAQRTLVEWHAPQGDVDTTLGGLDRRVFGVCQQRWGTPGDELLKGLSDAPRIHEQPPPMLAQHLNMRVSTSHHCGGMPR